MKKEDILDRLKEEYDKSEVPAYMFDTSRVFKRIEEEKKKEKKKIAYIVASITAIVVISVGIINLYIRNTNNIGISTITVNAIYNNTTSDTIKINHYNTNAYYEKARNVVTIKIDNIEEYVIIDKTPYTIVKAKVTKQYLGDTANEIEIYVPGGVFSVEDIKEKMNYHNIDEKYSDNDLVNVEYYNEIYIPIAEKGKEYIATLVKEGEKYFVDLNKPYGFKEYNSETNIVKDDMGDVELEIDKYIELINEEK